MKMGVSGATPPRQTIGVIMANGIKPTQELDAHGRHRLVLGDRATEWAGYCQFTYLKGYVGVTGYYTGTGGCVLTAGEFCARAGVR